MHEELIEGLKEVSDGLGPLIDVYGFEATDRMAMRISEAIAALSQPAGNSGQLAGWQWVPVEPTPEMIDAARSQSSFPAGVYRAMLSAAPVAAPSGWLDIESAPIGDADFLVYMPEERRKIREAWQNKNGVMVIGGVFSFDYQTKPTHWAPKPAPPESSP